MPKTIKLTKGRVAVVDDEDYDVLIRHSWHLAVSRYAASRINNKKVLMHRMIMNPGEGFEVDHINADGLDNRKSNLRICTHQQNITRTRRVNRTGYRGVAKDKKRYIAQLKHNGRRFYWGPFDTPALAALEYNKHAKEVFGEFARLNVIPKEELTETYRREYVRRKYENVSLSQNNSSGYRGVSWHKQNETWCAEIRHQKTRISIGCTKDKEEASYLYDQVAFQLLGDKARLNTPFE